MTEVDAWKCEEKNKGVWATDLVQPKFWGNYRERMETRNAEPLYSGETIQELIDETWQEALQEHGDNSDKALGMKILARKLKQEFKQKGGEE